VSLAHRRICGLSGRAFAIVVPPDETETEREELCGDCARLQAPPSEPEVAVVHVDGAWDAEVRIRRTARRWVDRHAAIRSERRAG
jgi:hypothetical protein